MDALVVGVGNPVRGDDGAGIELVRRLQDRTRRREIEVRELNGDATQLLDAWCDRDAVVIVDSARSGAAAGTIRRFDASSMSLPAELCQVSTTHALGLAETIELARALGRLPAQVIVFAIEGRQFEAGAGLSKQVEAALPEVANLVLAEISTLNRKAPAPGAGS